MTTAVTTNITTYVAATIASVAIPASNDGRYPAGRHLAGIGLFVAESDGGGGWKFAQRARAIAAGIAEADLLEWLADRLPAAAMLIGWNIDHELVPPLLDAASDAEPAVACHFVARFARVLRGGVIDMAMEHGGASAPPFAAVTADMAIFAPTMEADTIATAWALGTTDQLRMDLAAEALALWRVFVRTAHLAGMEAKAATDAWAEYRAQLRLVKRADSASGSETEERGNRG